MNFSRWLAVDPPYAEALDDCLRISEGTPEWRAHLGPAPFEDQPENRAFDVIEYAYVNVSAHPSREEILARCTLFESNYASIKPDLEDACGQLDWLECSECKIWYRWGRTVCKSCINAAETMAAAGDPYDPDNNGWHHMLTREDMKMLSLKYASPSNPIPMGCLTIIRFRGAKTVFRAVSGSFRHFIITECVCLSIPLLHAHIQNSKRLIARCRMLSVPSFATEVPDDIVEDFWPLFIMQRIDEVISELVWELGSEVYKILGEEHSDSDYIEYNIKRQLRSSYAIECARRLDEKLGLSLPTSDVCTIM